MSEWKGTDLENWEEFLERLDRLRRLWRESESAKALRLLFRGDVNPRRNLETSLERSKLPVTFEEYFDRIVKIRPEAEGMTGHRWNSMPDQAAYLEWINSLGDDSKLPSAPPGCEYLAYLRHHGFPSPFLDWSRSPCVAAYFAFSNAEVEDTDERCLSESHPLRRCPFTEKKVSLYVYWEVSGTKINDRLDKPRIFSIGHYIRTHHRHFRQQSEYTFCVRQEGDDGLMFAPHDEAVMRCDDLPDNEVDEYIEQRSPDLAWKFNVPVTEKWKILRHLDEHNVNGFTLFGTEDELMKTLVMRDEIQRWRGSA